MENLAIHLVKRFANEVVGPKVREMDEKENMDSEIIKGLFDQGVCHFLKYQLAEPLLGR